MQFLEQYFHIEHLWAAMSDENVWYIGVSDYAQQNLGEVMYLDLPEVPGQIRQGISLGAIESAKVVSDLISPVDGKIIEVNAVLEAEPWTINEEAQGKGWIAKIELDNKDQIRGLLSHEEYLSKLGLDA